MNLAKKNDFYLFKSFLCLGFLSFIICIIFSTTLWKDLYYTSDGFHVFSFLRNINNGQGLYEGPTFENLLGIHSYYTLLLLLPLTKIFATPLTLVFVVIGVYLSSSIIIFMICIENKISKLYSIIISILFSLSVFSSNGISSVYLFQPDLLAIPFTLAIFLFAQKRSKAGVIISLILLLLTKEEYILWSIFYIYIAVRLLKPRTEIAKKKLLSDIASSYLLVSISSLILLIVFKVNNSSSPFVGGIKNISMENIDFQSMLILIFDPSNFIFYWIIFTIVMILSCKRNNYPEILITILPLSILIVTRVYSNQLIYGNSAGQIWSFYSVLLPSLYFSLIYTFSFSYKDNIKFYDNNSLKLFLLFMYSTLLILIITKGINAINIRLLNNNRSITRIEALSKLNNKIPKIKDQKEYFLVDEFLMAPFMQRSHVSLDYVFTSYQNNKIDIGKLEKDDLQNSIEGVISEATFAISKCDSNQFKRKFLEDRGWYSELDMECSDDYLLMYPPKSIKH